MVSYTIGDSYSRCLCINSTTKLPKHVENIEVKPPDSSCNSSEIIITVKSSRHCLNPKNELGEIVISCWNEDKTTLKKLMQCVKTKWRNLPNKNKKLKRKRRKSKNKRRRKQL
ncbi:platelet factor 4-like isoform X2 [Dendropsophus ebraccatus]|uniref:platelet factor 4-like isoform X2 n=1 Tax=Dendropsophus ebraccatus TaxID=150705 RepID=UPI003831EE1C